MGRTGLAAILTSFAVAAAAQQALEVIALRHRTAEQVLPVLRPLLETGGTLTGQRNQLIVRTSPGNLAQLRQALDAIDRPLRRLEISVRFDDSAEVQRREIETGGHISNRDARVDIRGQDRRSTASERVDQRIQVLEGGRALIMAGRVRPLPGGTWETATGFEAVPRLSGSTVLVDLAPQQQSFERQQRMASTVSARLGEWFEVGGALSQSARDERGVLSRERTRAFASRRVWLKVEELP